MAFRYSIFMLVVGMCVCECVCVTGECVEEVVSESPCLTRVRDEFREYVMCHCAQSTFLWFLLQFDSYSLFLLFFEGDIRERKKKNNTQSNHLFVSSWSAYLLIVKEATCPSGPILFHLSEDSSKGEIWSVCLWRRYQPLSYLWMIVCDLFAR